MSIPRGEIFDTITLYREEITPEIAEEMKKHANPKNRHISPTTVAAYANDMANNKWDANAVSPIVFNKDGVMVDGHHRIESVIKSNTPIITYVCEDADPSFLYNLDYARTKNNILQMNGVSNVNNNTTALINAIGEFCFGVKKVSVGELEKAYLADGFIINEITRIAQLGATKPIMRSTPFTAAMYCAYHSYLRISLEELEEFAKAVNSGFITDDKKTAALALRNQILANRSWRGGTIRKEFFFYTQEAICDFCTNKPRKMAYRGKNAFLHTQFTDAFRDGTLFKETQ